MRIENLITESHGGRTRVAATVTWEDCDRPTQEIYFETEAEFAGGMLCNPNAFLTACVLPAMLHGEERVSVDGRIDPELKDGLVTAMSLMRYWYDLSRRIVRI